MHKDKDRGDEDEVKYLEKSRRWESEKKRDRRGRKKRTQR
jgi:hypothetical protein